MSDAQERMKINWVTTFILILYPLLVIGFTIAYGYNFGITWFEICFLLVGYYAANISVGIGFHRLWAHGAYKTNKFVETVLVFLTAGTLQGPVLAWASDHYKHHTFTDEERDPHTPLKYTSKLKGFLWSHIGWMLVGEASYKHIDRTTMHKLGKNRLLVWQLKYYWQIATFMNAIVPALLGFIIGGDLQSAFAGYVFIGLGRAIQQQITFCVNSLCHFVGQKKYYVGTARDIWWMFFLLLGENWHNFHHAFARDYRNGHKWYHMDVHKWIIYLMEKLGLAYDLVRTPEERILAKLTETQSTITQDMMLQIEKLERMARHLSQLAREKLEIAEKSAERLAKTVHVNLKKLEQRAENYANTAKQLLERREEISEKLIEKALYRFNQIEMLAKNLGVHLPTLQLK